MHHEALPDSTRIAGIVLQAASEIRRGKAGCCHIADQEGRNKSTQETKYIQKSLLFMGGKREFSSFSFPQRMFLL